jgi:hypothetical protein
VVTIFATLLPLAEEAWQPVLFGGLIPVLGALAVGYLLYRAVRDTDETDDGDEPGDGPDEAGRGPT